MLPSGEGLAVVLVQLGLLLLAGRLGGAAAVGAGYPSVAGELIAGVCLGYLALALGVAHLLGGPGLQGLVWLSGLTVVLAGFLDGFGRLPTPLSKVAGSSVFAGLAASLLAGAGVVVLLPVEVVTPGSELVAAGTIAAALLVVDVPLVGRLFREERLNKTDVALLGVAQASLATLLGWFVLSLVLGSSVAVHSQAKLAIAFFTGFFLLSFGLLWGRRAARRLVVRLERAFPARLFPLSVILSLACLLGALTEWTIGHALAGAALVGWAVGNLTRFAERDGLVLGGVSGSVAGPFLFSYIGSTVSLERVGDPLGVAVAVGLVAGLAMALRGVAVAGGAWAARLSWADALAVGIAANLRGGTAALVGFVALKAGVIGNELFVALVALSILSSVFTAPCLRWSISRRRRLDFSLFRQVVIVGELQGNSRREVIRELVVEMGKGSDLGDRELIIDALLEREESMPTGLPNGLAIPHTRLPGLDRPYLAIGRSPRGVDFDAPDGQPAKLIFLLLSPQRDEGTQLQALATIASAMNDPERRTRLLDARDTNELLMHFEEVFQG